jgi:hypothetical protein
MPTMEVFDASRTRLDDVVSAAKRTLDATDEQLYTGVEDGVLKGILHLLSDHLLTKELCVFFLKLQSTLPSHQAVGKITEACFWDAIHR